MRSNYLIISVSFVSGSMKVCRLEEVGIARRHTPPPHASCCSESLTSTTDRLAVRRRSFHFTFNESATVGLTGNPISIIVNCHLKNGLLKNNRSGTLRFPRYWKKTLFHVGRGVTPTKIHRYQHNNSDICAASRGYWTN